MSRQKEEARQHTERKKGRSFLTAGIRFTGTLLLVALVAVCLPLTVPRFFGYHIYSVISGSMEPAIPTGSLVYIKTMEPVDMQKDDVIAFYGARDQASIITHRVVENRVVMGEFITKGDANKKEDMEPVSYDNFIGKVRLAIPAAGKAAQVFSDTPGKIAAAGLIVLAVFLHGAAWKLEGGEDRDENR